MSAVNLIPKPRIRARAQRRRVTAWSVGVGVYALAIAAMCVVVRLGGSDPDGQFDTQMNDAGGRITLAAETGRRLQADIARLERHLEAATTVGRHANWSLLLAALERTRGEEVVLESIEVAPAKVDAAARPDVAPRPPGSKPAAAKPVLAPAHSGQSFIVKITGFARTPGKVFAFARDLEALGPLENATIGNTRGARVGSMEVTGFDLTATISEKPIANAQGRASP